MTEHAVYDEDVSFEPAYTSVATLADDPAGLTCSVTVGRRWARGRARSVVGYPRFELAADAVRAGRHDVLLVPAAYPDIRNFFFQPELKAVETFLGTLPDMVFAVPDGVSGPSAEVVFHHPATSLLVTSLLQEREAIEGHGSRPRARVVHSTSNSMACRDALTHPGAAAAVTNSTSADHYGLQTVRVLSAGTAMGFVVFGRAGGR